MGFGLRVEVFGEVEGLKVLLRVFAGLGVQGEFRELRKRKP